jgi:hypothetical protein
MTIRLSERFFLVTYPDVPLYRVETVILDSNAVSAIYDWAQGKTEPNSADVIPMLDALRSVKHIELFYGAYESCWQFERGAPVSQSNFNMVRIHDFKFKVLAIDSVTRADKKDFNEWISPSRRGSINFLPEEETRLKHFKPDDETFKSLAQASMQEWVLYLLLLKHLRPVWDSEDIQELIASFKAWVDEVYKHRVGMLSIPTFVALMGFFRGSVTEQYFIAKTKFPQGGKTINRDLLLKKDRWEVDGLVRVARNLAFDAIYFRERIRWQSGIIQSPSSLEFMRIKPEVTGIITGDRAMNAINSQIKETVPVKGGPDALFMDLPQWSLLDQLNVEDEMDAFLRSRLGTRRKIATSEELLDVAFPLMDELENS